MVRTRLLGSLSAEDAALQPATEQNAELLDAVSKAASNAATKVVLRGLVGYTAVVVTGMATDRMGLGFLSKVALVSGVGFIASKSLQSE